MKTNRTEPERRTPALRFGFRLLAGVVGLAVWLAAPGTPSGTTAAAQQGSAEPGAGEGTDVATEARAWGAIVYAGPEAIAGLETGDAEDADAAVAARARLFEGVRAKLVKSFPAERHVLLAEHTQKIFKEYESWVVPSKELFLKIDSRGPAKGGGTKLGVQVWQGEKVLAKADAVLTPDKPLFIGGPKWRGGRLIFVVVLL